MIINTNLGIGNKKAGGSMSLGCLKISPARLSHLQVILHIMMNVERFLVRTIKHHRHSDLTPNMARSGGLLQPSESEDDGVLLQVVDWCQQTQ